MSRTYRTLGSTTTAWRFHVKPNDLICGYNEAPVPCRKLKSVDRRHKTAVFCDGMPRKHSVHEGCRVDGGVIRLGWLEDDSRDTKKFYKMQTVRAVRRGGKRQIAEEMNEV